MNIKVLVTLASIIAMSTANAQNHESADSLNRELQEIVFTAKQPATRLEGSTRFNYRRVQSQQSRQCSLMCSRNCP